MQIQQIESAQATGRPQGYARLAGAMYLVTMVTALFAEGFVRGSLYVSDSAAQTARNLIESDQLFRLALVADPITFCGVVVLIWTLYQLLRTVHQELATLAAFLRLVEVGVHISSTAFGAAALSLLARGEYTHAFQDPQLFSLIGLALRAQSAGLTIGFIPLGLGSAVFAYLLLRSGLVPRALAGWGVFASLLLAGYSLGVLLSRSVIDFFHFAMVPMFLYEVGLGAWLLFRGVNARTHVA